jgi:hypothetical protein
VAHRLYWLIACTGTVAPLAPDRRSRSFPVHDQTSPCASHPAQAPNGWYKPHRRSLALHPRYLRHGSHVGVPALRIQSSNATLRVHMALNEACPRAAGAPRVGIHTSLSRKLVRVTSQERGGRAGRGRVPTPILRAHILQTPTDVRARFSASRATDAICGVRWGRYMPHIHPSKVPWGARPTKYELSAWHVSSQYTCELYLSRDSSSPAYSSWLCI